jgi:hypothetical protein
MGEQKQRVDWKLEFGWRFWLPFVYIVLAISLAQGQHVVWAFASSVAAVLMAEYNGKYIARREAERKAGT